MTPGSPEIPKQHPRSFLENLKDRGFLFRWALPAVLVVIALLTSLRPLSFVRADFNFWLGILAVPFVLRIKQPGQLSYRYAFAVVLFLAFFVLTGVRTSFLAAFGCYLFFLVESTKGKLGVLPLVLLALISPVFKYFSMAWSFPLRLKLSLFSAKILNLMGRTTKLHGNMFTTGDYTFSVDEACAGLHMIVTALIVVLIFITYQERKWNRTLRLPGYLSLIVVGLALVLISNLFRIVGIVALVALPGSMAHDMIGLFALLVYVLVPMYFLCLVAVKRLGRPPKEGASPTEIQGKPVLKGFSYGENQKPKVALLTAGLLLLAMAVLGFRTPDVSPEAADPVFASIAPAGYERSLTELGILKLEKDSALIYVKPAARFFGSDHNPSICWRASGYAITGEYISHIGDREVIMAQLVKEDETLYTAWWFDNGREQTIGQWEWRVKAAAGEPPFRMVNVTSLSEAQLIEELEKVFFLSSQ